MVKIDKTRPDIIKLHERAPELAKRIIEYDTAIKKLQEEMTAIEHKIDLQDAYKTVIFDEIKKRCNEDIRIIAPEGDLKYEIDGTEVYLLKGNLNELCPDCGKMHPPFPPNMPHGLKGLMDMLKSGNAHIAGVSIGTIDDLPDELKDKFKRKK